LNSSSGDKGIFDGANLDLTNPFDAARAVMSNTCRPCHDTDFLQLTTEEQFKAGNWVVPQDRANSKLYYRLSNVTVGPGAKNMPQGEAPLSDEEIEIIGAWIDSLTP
jgi:hypothetical protein